MLDLLTLLIVVSMTKLNIKVIYLIILPMNFLTKLYNYIIAINW